jgi:NAD(P)-dependent dehydrogenase (short-subunit alcohol dehydrogenase family)
MSNMGSEGEFAGKVAIVTGGSGSMGAAFSRALAARGALVGILDINEAPAKALADELNGGGLRAIAVACDISDEDQVESAVTAVDDAFGGIDILINNAGLHANAFNKGFAQLGLAAARRLFDVNLMGSLTCALACQQAMTRRAGGVILNISSITSFLSANAYGVSKLALNGLTICLATEFAPNKIRVNGIAPGMIMTDHILQDDRQEMRDAYVRELQKVQRFGVTDDVVEAMLYLCSDRASFVTGETLKVSGGYPLFN